MSIFSEDDIKGAIRDANLDQMRTALKADFIQYLKDHPGERLWQAIRNFSGAKFVLVSDYFSDDGPKTITLDTIDTFYSEQRDGR